MIAMTAQKTIKSALRPFVENGLIPAEAWKELEDKLTSDDGKAKRPDLITRPEAAKLLQVSPRSLINYERQGLLQGVRIAGKRLVRYSLPSIERLIQSGTAA
ncbi:MAG: MerR family DNA-binding transcriptional regulator [Victivallales bacterium]